MCARSRVMAERRERLSVIIVSANSADWLRPCLTTVFERAGNVELDVVVVASGCTDETVPLVEREFPNARTISCANRGFAYANNRALRTVDADWVLFLNPDTEILAGSFADLIYRLRSRATVGLVGVRQLTSDGQVFPTIRRFPNAIRSLFEALASERFPFRASWLGERELDLSMYERDVACDWTSGSFMLVRWEALQSAGFMDERFFLYCEETDLCLRIRQAGWEIRHVPYLTILHHAEKGGWNPRLDAQAAFAKRQYFEKHLPPLHRFSATAALLLGYTLRSVLGRGDPGRQQSSRAALTTLLGLRPPPFGMPPRVAVTYDHPNVTRGFRSAEGTDEEVEVNLMRRPAEQLTSDS
jgi:N-acetylglucosaminyl-diphospho-decaprenol L-rhamnosyltransferase